MKPGSRKAIFKMAPHMTGARSLFLTMGTFIRHLCFLTQQSNVQENVQGVVATTPFMTYC